MIKLKAIFACDCDGVIGINNTLPWHIKEDLQYFKSKTENQVVIMGSKTWESLPKKPLANRINVVVSTKTKETDEVYYSPVVYIDSLERLGELRRLYSTEEFWVIGGLNLIKQLLDQIDEIHLTALGQYFVPYTEEDEVVRFDPNDMLDSFIRNPNFRTISSEELEDKKYGVYFRYVFKRKFKLRLVK